MTRKNLRLDKWRNEQFHDFKELSEKKKKIENNILAIVLTNTKILCD